jgi:hypothetical protein
MGGKEADTEHSGGEFRIFSMPLDVITQRLQEAM